MQRHFDKDIEALRTKIIKMGSLVEQSLETAIKSLTTHDRPSAKRILDEDEEINALEVRIDNAIVDLVALNQPVAVDLRLILAAQKINNDLERIGDHAVNIAESSLLLDETVLQQSLTRVQEMGKVVLQMVHRALDGFVHLDPVMSQSVLDQDDLIDEMNRSAVRDVVRHMKSDAENIDAGLELIRVSRNLERIADLATNIAEEVIFIAQARVVKHGGFAENA